MKLPIALLLCGIAVLWFAYKPTQMFLDRPLNTTLTEVSAETPLRLSIMGTSLTANYDWPERLERCLAGELMVTKIAEGGAGSDWGLTQLDKLDSSDPDLVLVEFSINDADLRLGISRMQSRANHKAILQHLRQVHPDAKIVLMTMNPAHGLRRYLLRPRLPAYYGLYPALAEEFEAGLLDLYPRWQILMQSAREQTDGLHPSQDAAARVILPALSTYLGVSLDPVCAGLDQT